MALDFYDLEDIHFKHKLFEIGNNEFEDIKDVFKELEQISGINIDPYATTRIYPNHVQFIISCIDKHNKKSTKRRKYISQILDKFLKVKGGLLVVGD
jgi:hypothetical protein